MRGIVLFLMVFAMVANGRQQNQQQTNDESRWAVPNVSYTCVARLFQDWARGNGGSIGLKSKSFVMNMRTANKVELSAKDFEVNEHSELKTYVGTDLEFSSVTAKLNSSGDHGVNLEVYLSTKPELLNKEIMVLGEEFKDSVVPKIGASTRLWVGDREDIGRNGPIMASVDCELKSLWRN